MRMFSHCYSAILFTSHYLDSIALVFVLVFVFAIFPDSANFSQTSDVLSEQATSAISIAVNSDTPVLFTYTATN